MNAPSGSNARLSMRREPRTHTVGRTTNTLPGRCDAGLADSGGRRGCGAGHRRCERRLITNNIAARVDQIIESATKTPDNSKCVALTNLAKVSVISLNPDGEIDLAAGEKTTIVIKGATAPRVWPLFAQSDKLKTVVTANIQNGNMVEVSAAGATDPGLYPFVVMDGVSGKPFTINIKSADDEPVADQCKPPPRRRGRRLRRTTNHPFGAAGRSSGLR
jgi:hypothetical protein